MGLILLNTLAFFNVLHSGILVLHSYSAISDPSGCSKVEPYCSELRRGVVYPFLV
jgi:hypothetical protein